MENIDNFLTACCKLGVPAHALVDTADIFEMRDTPRVVECLVSDYLVGWLRVCWHMHVHQSLPCRRPLRPTFY